MSDCWCDYETPEFLSERSIAKSKKHHSCCECRRKIAPGESYRATSGKWDGDFMTYKTCARCIELESYVKAHVPCFCWAFGDLIHDSTETLRGYSDIPGLLFGAYRRIVKIRRVELTK